MIAHYEVLEKIGEGGLGVVYRALDTRLRRTVALKFLKPEAWLDPTQKERLFREAQAAAALDHPNVCTVYEIGEVEDQTFIVMAYVEGEGLDSRIRSGQLPLREALEIAIQVGEGLSAAHEKGIVHRDIKPANVRVTRNGQAKILDFGLARLGDRTAITRAGTTMGTVAYMSPEQARGKEADRRTDIWALGVVLFEMIAGERPFKGEHAQVVLRAILEDPPPLLSELRPGISPELQRVMAKALTKDRRQRYQSISELVADLRAVQRQLTGEVSEAVTAVGGERASAARDAIRHRIYTHRVPAMLGGFAVFCAVALVAVRALIDRFPLAPQLQEITLVLLGLLLPLAVLLAISPALPRGGPWRGIRTVGVPLWSVGSIGFLALLLGSQPFWTVTRVFGISPDGEQIERLVPKTEFRKSIAIFPFVDVGGAAGSESRLGTDDEGALDWLEHGLCWGLVQDLSQDPYLRVGSGFVEEFRAAGYADGKGLPSALIREIAAGLHYEHYVKGQFAVLEDSLLVTTELYSTSKAAPLRTRRITGILPSVVDTLSAALRRDLGLPRYHIGTQCDLPLGDMLTDSLSAMQALAEGLYERLYENDPRMAARCIEEAIRIDSTFAYAYSALANVYIAQGRTTAAEGVLRNALRYEFRLCDTDRFWLRHDYHLARGDFAALSKTIQDCVELYPEWVTGHELLADDHARHGRWKEAIAVRKQILAMAPDRHDQLLEIAEQYAHNDHLSEALRYYQQYAVRLPEEHETYVSMGDIYVRMAGFEQAAAQYDKARLRAPNEVGTYTRLAGLDRRRGEFARGEARLQEALSLARTPDERSTVYGELVDFHKARGQIGQALEYTQSQLAEMARIASPIALSFARISLIDLLVSAGRGDSARAVAREIESQAEEGWMRDYLGGFARVVLYSALEDSSHIDDLREVLQRVEAIADTGALQVIGPLVPMMRVQLLELEGDYEGAIRVYESMQTAGAENMQRVAGLEGTIGICYRKLGDYRKAEKGLLKALAVWPHSPSLHREIALTYDEMGEYEKARGHLRRALEVWAEADADYKPAREAREKLRALQPGRR